MFTRASTGDGRPALSLAGDPTGNCGSRREPAEPDAIVVGNRMLWTQVRIIRRPGQTEIDLRAGGLTLTGFLLSTFGVVRNVRRVLRDAPGLQR
jgi:hypothetical protein